MAKKRTKKQKRKVTAKRQQQKFTVPASVSKKIAKETAAKTFSLPVASSKAATMLRKQDSRLNLTKLFGYDSALIYQDLRKTLLVTIIVILVLIALTVYN